MKGYVCDSCGATEPVNAAADVLPKEWTRIEVARNNVQPVTMHLCGDCSGGTWFSATERRNFVPAPRPELGARSSSSSSSSSSPALPGGKGDPA